MILGALLRSIPDASLEQQRAWGDSVRILREEGAKVLRLRPSSADHGAVMEYELPREGGRRPDVIVLQNGVIAVLEFKTHGRPHRADVDQVRAYARDLAQYHSECRDVAVVPILVLGGARNLRLSNDQLHVVSGDRLGELLVEVGRSEVGTPIDIAKWLGGEYLPLPTLVIAARMLFEKLPLPFIRRARSAGVPDTVALCLGLARQAHEQGRRSLVLVTGVPGAGKTLVGLQVAHSAEMEAYRREHRKGRGGAPATFLSGNGPLIQVLQDALHSRTFVQDMHRYIRDYGLKNPDRIPPDHLIVFDEAQRAWDAAKVEDWYSRKALGTSEEALRKSEPQLLVEVADRLPNWAMVLGLVGGGQEIHTGEEGGMNLWVDALERSAQDWSVHGPASLGELFRGSRHAFTEHAELDLDTTLRAHTAEDLHLWARLLLDEADLDGAAEVAAKLARQVFPIYVSRDLERARHYVRSRFAGEPLRRYGILASSKCTALLKYGLDPTFQATRRIPVGLWFNAEPSDHRSCCQLTSAVTEFQAQGLELDLPIVGWGEDFLWGRNGWLIKSGRRSRLVHDPMRLRRNAYRVLVTRGREGLVLFVPPESRFDSTYQALVQSGGIATVDPPS
ncbi:MAG: DUF2075 domain-containing protein [Planctomycetes bacterium]|nr:DUF2075 domain-containing protein [Planctomycetota bacterium]